MNIATITANSANPFSMVTALRFQRRPDCILVHYFFCCLMAVLGRE